MMNIKKKENYRKQGRKYFDEMLKKYTIPAIQTIVGGREDTGLCTTSKMAYATWATRYVTNIFSVVTFDPVHNPSV